MQRRSKQHPYRQAHWLLPVLLTGGCIVSCGGGTSSGTTATPTPTPSTATATGGVVDEAGATINTVGMADPVNIQLRNLTPNEQVRIEVRDPAGTLISPEGGFVATADEDGEIPTATLVQDLSLSADGPLVMRKGVTPHRTKASAGTYRITVVDHTGAVALNTSFIVEPRDAVYCSDSSGNARGSFVPADTVYATLTRADNGTLADGGYTCYVRSDLAAQLEDQAVLSGTPFSITTSGGKGTATLGSANGFGEGPFDVVCDIDGDGRYDRGGDLMSRSDRFRACFTVQRPNSGNDIIGQVCADRLGNYRDMFDPNAANSNIRDVFAWITPSEQSLVQHTVGVRKYVVTHRSSWSDGDALVDVTGTNGEAFERDAVQAYCTNEAPWLVWPRQRLVAGCYDCVIDINFNGVYDRGIDLLDNIDQRGDNTYGGMCVAASSCDRVAISSHTDGTTVDTTAITLAGTIAGTTDSAYVTITAGAQSQTIVLNVTGGTFTANIPLFHGVNHITVASLANGATACSKTIAVTSTATGSADRAFQVQLTWSGSTDMDLHVVKPGGLYANGGGGTTDCNYANCSVGLSGSGTNTIDWGTASTEQDDPKLDVDCIACGNGVENIWMSEVREDGAYRVYVDAFGGNETANVLATIFIGGANVGQVNCGPMASGSSTDSCFVGTITWTGGIGGSGTFAPAGSVAANY